MNTALSDEWSLGKEDVTCSIRKPSPQVPRIEPQLLAIRLMHDTVNSSYALISEYLSCAVCKNWGWVGGLGVGVETWGLAGWSGAGVRVIFIPQTRGVSVPACYSPAVNLLCRGASTRLGPAVIYLPNRRQWACQLVDLRASRACTPLWKPSFRGLTPQLTYTLTVKQDHMHKGNGSCVLYTCKIYVWLEFNLDANIYI